MRERLMAGVASGMGAGALWGLVFLAPQLLAAFSPLQLALSRYLAYGAVAALVLAPRARRTAARLGRAEWWALVRLSLLGNLIYYVLLGSAVQWAGGAATALIIGLLPVVVTVIGTRAAGAVGLPPWPRRARCAWQAWRWWPWTPCSATAARKRRIWAPASPGCCARWAR